MATKLTPAEIEVGKSPNGGFTRAQLAEWGVPWPAPSGWKKALIEGAPIDPSPIRPRLSAHELLRKVVLAVVESGHASDLYAYPDVLEYFSSARDC